MEISENYLFANWIELNTQSNNWIINFDQFRHKQKERRRGTLREECASLSNQVDSLFVSEQKNKLVNFLSWLGGKKASDI